MRFPFSLPRLVRTVGLSLVLALAACHAPQATTVQAAPDSLATLSYDGDQMALVALDSQLAAAGQDPSKLAPIAERLFRILASSTASRAGRQAAAQRLALFPAELLTKPGHARLWARLFADANQIELARLALDTVPGRAIDALYLRAFDCSTPATRLALLQSIAFRRLADATSRIAPLLQDADLAISSATAYALGRIGTPAAIDFLNTSANATSPAIIAARIAAIHHFRGSAGMAELQTIVDAPGTPAHARAAAAMALLFAEPASSSERLVDLLLCHDLSAKSAALEALAFLPAKDLVQALTSHLAAFDPATQTAVITALGLRGDPAAVPDFLRMTESKDAAVRTAAITALGRLPGSPAVAVRLAHLVSSAATDEAKLARQALARLDGPQVAATVLAHAELGERSLRLVFIEALATRGCTESVPQLLKLREDPDAAIRTAALGALEDLASPAQQPALLDWTLAAADPTEQSRALKALAVVTLRVPDATTRARLVTEAIDLASPAVAQRLLPVLPRIGGAACAACAARLAQRDDLALATAACSILVRWTDVTGIEPLVLVAEKAPQSSVRSTAISGAVRYLQRSHELTSTQLRGLAIRLLAASDDLSLRRELVYLLGRCTDVDTLTAIEPFMTDPALAAEASDAALAIRARLANPTPSIRCSDNPDQVPNLIDGKMKSSWNVTALATQWIELDFKTTRPFRQIVVDGGKNESNYPEQLDICVTADPATPGEPLVSVPGHVGRNVIDLPATAHGRYLIIRHSKVREDAWWTVAELTWD